MFKNIKLRDLILALLSCLLGATGGAGWEATMGSSSGADQEVVFAANDLLEIPIIQDGTIQDDAEGSVFQVFCNCKGEQEKTTNVAGSTNQPEIPYTDQDTELEILAFQTKLRPGAITEDVLNENSACGEKRLATKVLMVLKVRR